MKFSIVHATARVTAEYASPWWKSEYEAWRTCDRPQDVEYILVVHDSRIAKFYCSLFTSAESSMRWGIESSMRWGKFTVCVNYGRDCIVDQANVGRAAATGEIVMGNQDDMRYPEHWDSQISALIPDTSRRAFVHASCDGQRPDLLTLPEICTRSFWRECGGFHPDYESMCADDDWSERARRMGGIIEAPQLHFRHLHPLINSTAEVDDVYRLQNRKQAYEIGAAVLARRQAEGFPRVPFNGEVGESETPARTIAIVIPGESHRAEWEMSFFALVAALSNSGWNVRITPGYSTNVYHTRMGMTRDVINDAEALGEPELVLWIDDDNTPSIQAVTKLIAALDSLPEISGAAGWCWIKTAEKGKALWMPSCGNFHPDSLLLASPTLETLFADRGAPKTIEWSGFPTLLMRYPALKALGPEAFSPLVSPENEFGFTGEDIAFFVCARERGFKFVVVPHAKVHHLKFNPIEPDYQILLGAKPEVAQAIESDRDKRNGPRVEVSQDDRTAMEALM